MSLLALGSLDYIYRSLYFLMKLVSFSGPSLLWSVAAIRQHVDAPVVPDGGLEPFAVVALGPERLEVFDVLVLDVAEDVVGVVISSFGGVVVFQSVPSFINVV